MWFFETDAISSGNAKLLMFFIGLVAVSMAVQAITVMVLTAKGMRTIKELTVIVEELKTKAIPLMHTASAVATAAQAVIQETAEVVREAAPKVKTVTDNLVNLSETAKASAQQMEKTVADANLRTQRQVARVDGMITAALTTTAELVETVNHGIRGPAHKIAVMTTQAKLALEGLLEKVTGKGGPGGRPGTRL